MDSPPQDSSSPVSRKRAHPPCDLTADFMNDSFDQLFADENEEPFCLSQVSAFPKTTPFRPVVPGGSKLASPATSPSLKSSYIPFAGRSSPFRSPSVPRSRPFRPSSSPRSPLSQATSHSPSVIQAKDSPLNSGVGNPSNEQLSSANSLYSQFSTFDNQLESGICDSMASSRGGVSSGIIDRLRQNVATSSAAAGILSGLERALQLQSQLQAVDPLQGLPARTWELLQLHKGISHLYPWQRECLGLPAVVSRRNLVYSLPTSGGKTLVAEILLLREMLCHDKDVVFIMPYVSLVQEKVRGLSPFAVELGFAIEECAGAKGAIPPRRRRRRRALYACTIEKARALVDALCEEGRLHELGLVAVDELHMVGEVGGRGAALEATLAKLLAAAPDTQLVGMSATLSNISELAAFLRADVYRRDFRPVELREMVKVGDELFEAEGGGEWRMVRRLDFGYTRDMRRRDPDMIAGLVREVIPENACLVFCPTKKHCENVALTVCSLLPAQLREHRREEKARLLEALREEGGGEACETLLRCFPYGVAYHHGGLTMDERKLIEEAYLGGALCCLCCTSTLAAGVNLPAKRVVLRAPYVGPHFITLSRYKQMVGRAGRAGLDSSGESVLVIQPGDRAGVAALLESPLDVCRSNFVTQPELVPPLVLSLAGLGLAANLKELRDFWERTLAAAQGSTFDAQEVVDALVYGGLLRWAEGGRFCVTPLGRAAFRGGVGVEAAETFQQRLREVADGMVLHSHLHLLHLVTPDEFLATVPFCPEVLLQEVQELSAGEMRAAEACGASERAVVLAAAGRWRTATQLHRFQLTLVLYALWRQCGVWAVARRFRMHRGTVQALLAAAGAQAATLAAFCAELEEFWAFRALLPDFARQLSYCVSSELLPLLELPAVKRGRARQLHAAGFRSLADVARADPEQLAARLGDCLPRRQARQMVAAAKMLLTEKAEALRDEAEVMMEEFDTMPDSCLFPPSAVASLSTVL